MRRRRARARRRNPSFGDVAGFAASFVGPTLVILTGGDARVAVGTVVVGALIASAFAYADGHFGAPSFTRGYAVGSVAQVGIGAVALALTPKAAPPALSPGATVVAGQHVTIQLPQGVKAGVLVTGVNGDAMTGRDDGGVDVSFLRGQIVAVG